VYIRRKPPEKAADGQPAQTRPASTGEKLQVTLELDLPAGTYTARWVDPVTGSRQVETLRHNGGVAWLRSPQFADDVALAVQRIDAGR
jgi:hypothetical protein